MDFNNQIGTLIDLKKVLMQIYVYEQIWPKLVIE